MSTIAEQLTNLKEAGVITDGPRCGPPIQHRGTAPHAATPGLLRLPAALPASPGAPPAVIEDSALAAHRIAKKAPLTMSQFNALTFDERNAYIRNGNSIRDDE